MGGPGSRDVIGVEVDELHQRGSAIHARSADGGTTARRLLTGLDSAHGQVGHPVVKSAMSAFLQSDIVDHAQRLGHDIGAAGHHVGNVASVSRASDEAGAAGIRPVTDWGL